MEKGWIRGQMKMLEKNADNRKLEEIKKERLALQELKREKQREPETVKMRRNDGETMTAFGARIKETCRKITSER